MMGLSACRNSTTNSDAPGLAPASRGEVQAGKGIAEVQTSAGMIAGYIDGATYTFKGVPYAQAERFMAPRPVTPWQGVRSCRQYGPVSPQAFRTDWHDDANAFGSDWDDGYAEENCQNLNIWTPGLDDKKRPVMVWLHGGGFAAGSSHEMPSYDGTSLSETGDVVIVSVNHRLNVLGFLDLSAYGDKYKDSGNVGMLDIREALRWVQQNIANFGGDPGNVTLFGQSGGGGKVCTLMSMPSAKGLFHKAIAQSGAHIENMQSKHTRMIGQLTLKKLGITSGTLDKLSDVPYDALLKAGNEAIAEVKEEITKSGEGDIFLFGWSPVVDGALLPKDPFANGASEWSADIPFMVGNCLHEFAFSSVVPEGYDMTADDAKRYLQGYFGSNTERIIQAFDKAYPDHRPCDLLDVENEFRQNSVKAAKAQAQLGGAPVWNFIFTWESPMLNHRHRSSHCMDIPFVMNNVHLCRNLTGGGEGAYRMADLMSRIWIQFARTGNPNVEGLPEWHPFDATQGAVMLLGDTCQERYAHDWEWLDLLEAAHYSKFHLLSGH